MPKSLYIKIVNNYILNQMITHNLKFNFLKEDNRMIVGIIPARIGSKRFLKRY